MAFGIAQRHCKQAFLPGGHREFSLVYSWDEQHVLLCPCIRRGGDLLIWCFAVRMYAGLGELRVSPALSTCDC